MFGMGRQNASRVSGWASAGAFSAALIVLAGCVTVIYDTPQPAPPATPTAVAAVTPVLPTDPPTLAPTLPPPTPTAPPPTPAITATAPSPESTLPVIDPLSEEALVASMIDPIQDVDATAETSGVDVGTEADDLPAFAEQGGLRRAAQTISVGFDYTVFDFRYQFPDADSAAAFLEAEADGLGETHLGGVEGLPPAQLGDETRYYTSHTAIFVTQDSFNYLIRVENVVAKVWIGGDPEFINAEEALDIATSAWGRMTIVFDPSEVGF